MCQKHSELGSCSSHSWKPCARVIQGWEDFIISSQRTGWVQNERGKLKAQTSMFEGSTPKPSGVILYMLFSTMLTCLLCLLILESFLVALHWLRMFKSTVSAAKSTHSQGLYPSIPYIMLKNLKSNIDRYRCTPPPNHGWISQIKDKEHLG